MERILWSSDEDLNGCETIARVVEMNGSCFLEVINNRSLTFAQRLKVAWRILRGKTKVFSFILMNNNDETFIRRAVCDKQDNKSQ